MKHNLKYSKDSNKDHDIHQKDFTAQLAQIRLSENTDTNSNRINVDDYLYTVSHELKSPLREIELLAKFILEDNSDALRSESVEDLETIRNICNSSVEMVDHIMEFAKVSNIPMNRSVINVKSLIQNSFLKLMRSSGDINIDLKVDELPELIGDEFLIEHMITNILTNSVKFSKEVSRPSIHVFSYEIPGYVAYCFEDNGIGMDMRYAQNIFNVFERLHNEDEYEGFGIGLAIVKRIVERYGGYIDVFGLINKGCTVKIFIPSSFTIPRESILNIEDKKKTKIFIGVLITSSGKYSSGAMSRRYAYELAANEINASGGISGKQIELIFRDFKCDADLAEEQAWELIEVEKVDVIMGGYLSPVRERIRKICDKTHTLYFYNSQYEGGVADHFTFCLSVVPEQNIFSIIDYLFNLYGKKIFILVTDYNYGILTAECVKSYVRENGGEIAGTEYFLPSKLNFRITIENIIEANPDILFTVLMGDDQNDFHRQWMELGKKEIPVISATGIDIFHLHKKYPAPTMGNTYFMASYIEESDELPAKAFTEAMRKITAGKQIEYIDLDAEPAYSSIYLYKKAVELTGSTDTEALIRTLESGTVTFDSPGGKITIRGEDHHTVRDLTLYRTDDSHNILPIEKFSEIKSDFIENIIEQESGIKGGLSRLGINAPNVQYNPMFHNTN